MGIDELKGELRRAKSAHSRSVALSSKLVKGVLVIACAGVAGVAQFWTWPVGKTPEPSQIVGIMATFGVILGGIFVLSTETDAAAAIEVADKALEEARDAESKFEGVSDLFTAMDRLTETYQICLNLRGALEQAGVGSSGTLENLIGTMFGLISRPLSVAAGFENADRWTIGVYRAVASAQPSKADLRCIAQKRAIECKLEEARVWPEGVGIAGIAYSNAREVVIPNLAADGVQAVFGPRDATRQYDVERYASMVAVPIMVAGRERPWGVITATSDRIGHFHGQAEAGFKTDEPIRAVGSFIALAVAIHDQIGRARTATVPARIYQPPPPPTPATPVTTGSHRQS
jgi:hypothetical protein